MLNMVKREAHDDPKKFFEETTRYSLMEGKESATTRTFSLKKSVQRPAKADSSDNGSPFQSEEYENFAKGNAFKIVTSSPKYPQSNGKVKNAVNTAKMFIIKAENWIIGLMEYTATRLTGIEYSSAQVMFVRNIRTELPSTSQSLLKATIKDVQIKTKVRRNGQKYYYNGTVRGSLEPSKLDKKCI